MTEPDDIEDVGVWIHIPLDTAPDDEIIHAAVLDPRTRPIVVDELRRLGWTVTEPGDNTID